VMVTNAFPPRIIFDSASAGCTFTNGLVLCDAGTLPAGGSSNFTFSITPTGVDSLTNAVAVWGFTPDPDLLNNQASSATTFFTAAPPAVYIDQTNVLTTAGTSLTLNAIAFGVLPLDYQWLFENAPLGGQTAASLVLTNLQLLQSGHYSVVVTNINGSDRASDVQLTVIEQPSIQLATTPTAGGNVSVSLMSVAGLVYTLEYKDSLTQPVWTSIPPPVSGTGSVVSLVDTNAVTPTRFYRVTAH